MSGLTSFRNALDGKIAHEIFLFGLVNCLGDSFQRVNLSVFGFLDWMELCQYNSMLINAYGIIRHLVSMLH